ncbi:MAG: chemotaxis protein CheW [Veillonellales bacterium]
MATIRLVVFELNGEEYAVDALSVNGILRLKKFEIKKVPGLPQVIEGMISLRGKVNYIFNLKSKFGFPEIQSTEESKIIMLNVQNSIAGCIVDEVTDIVKIEDTDLQIPPNFIAQYNANYIRGIVKVGERLIVVLYADKLLSTEEYDAVCSSTH